jgi:hypothetical protein
MILPARQARAGAFALAAALALAAAAQAEETAPLSPEAFDALTRGKTMDTATAAGVYGVETFLPGRKVIWRDADRCVAGHWQAEEDRICFTYDDKPGRPVCWTYFDKGDFIQGWFEGEGPVSEPIMLTPGEGPVSCDFLGT